MSVVLGSPVPARLGSAAVPGGAFPDTPASYTSPEAAVVIPPGALDRWWNYRATKGAVRRDVVIFGDSTTFGAGGFYSWIQRVRDRSVSYGMADGGKGMTASLGEAGMLYDSPEVNSLVSYTFGGNGPFYGDLLGGGFFYDDGTTTPNATLNLQFRGTCLRLWYLSSNASGDFTYSLDGAAPVTVHSNVASGKTNPFIYFSGLTAGVTHTLAIINQTAGKECRIAISPMYDTGPVYQKFALTGSTFANIFFSGVFTSPYTQDHGTFFSGGPLGLRQDQLVTAASGYAGMSVDTSIPIAGRIDPVLAITDLGFNDLSNTSAPGEVAGWTEYIRRFAAACRAASCDGLVLSGQLPYNANWPTYGAARFNAVKTEALAQGLAFVDHFYPIGGPSLSYAGPSTNPHLTKAQYITQGDFLWDNVLALA